VELGSTRQQRVGEQAGITYQTGNSQRQNQTFEVKVEVL